MNRSTAMTDPNNAYNPNMPYIKLMENDLSKFSDAKIKFLITLFQCIIIIENMHFTHAKQKWFLNPRHKNQWAMI